MNLRIFTGLLFTLLFSTVFSQSQVSDVVQKIIQKPEYKNASIGIHFKDLKSGETFYELNSDKLLIPASTMKLVSSAAALELLGSNYRFKTSIAYQGKISKENTLNGDLIVIGGGDPTLGSEHFQDHYFNPHFLNIWVQKIKAAGIQKINGDIVFDASIYDTEKVPATWIWEDIANYYGAGANAFTVYDNLFRISFQSPKKAGELTKIIATYPKIEGLEIINEVRSSNVNRDLAYVFGSPLDKARAIRGTIPKNRKFFTIKAAIHQPEEILAQDLLESLAKEGVFINGEIVFEQRNKKDLQTIYIQESPTLTEIVKILNYKSINLFAEHLVRQIAAEKTGIGNRENGIEIIKEFWNSKGIETDNFFMEDGSGLSHFNAISPKHFTSILFFMNQSGNQKTFVQSLPSAGEGTITGFSTELFPNNTLKAKSGSMTRVRCYAGYLKLKSGKTTAFSIMFNNFQGTQLELINQIENLLLIIKKSY